MIAGVSLFASALGQSVVDQAQQLVQKSASAAAVGVDFSQLLADASAGAANTLKSGEATAIAGLQGKASVQEVVESVMNAEQTLHAAIAIRDKLVGAYQSLTQMAI